MDTTQYKENMYTKDFLLLTDSDTEMECSVGKMECKDDTVNAPEVNFSPSVVTRNQSSIGQKLVVKLNFQRIGKMRAGKWFMVNLG